MSTAPASAFESVLRRMYERQGVDTLPAHLERACGVTITKVSPLDVGVFRVDHADKGVPLVVRLFSADRSHAAAEGDLGVLRYLAEVGFPAERPFGDGALTSHQGQGVLVTEFVHQVPKAKRPPYPIVTLGSRIARLHALPVPDGADRPAGALHHFAEGTMADELHTVAGWLDTRELRVPAAGGAALDALRRAVASADGGDGLPEAFVHPDPVPKNAIFTAEGPVLVDWTAAGRGPRLPSLTLIYKSEWAAVPFMKGYIKRVTLTDDERARLPGLLFSRRLIDLVFRVCRHPASAARSAAKLPAIERDCEAQAHKILYQ